MAAHTSLNLRSLLLIRKKLPQLRLILVVELLEVEVLDSGLGGVHLGRKVFESASYALYQDSQLRRYTDVRKSS